jgi:membrane protein implicated in regulation of membrane protease activity
MSDVYQPQGPADPKPPARWTGAAVALLIIGLLILIPSGLCTSAFGIAALAGGFGSSGVDMSLLAMALIVGGPFVVLGALLVRTGLRKRDRR